MVSELMKDRGLARSLGCSWIKVKNSVHLFVVAERSHPESEKIYAKLGSLAHQMKEEGYMPDTNFVLHGEDEEEEYMLYVHGAI